MDSAVQGPHYRQANKNQSQKKNSKLPKIGQNRQTAKQPNARKPSIVADINSRKRVQSVHGYPKDPADEYGKCLVMPYDHATRIPTAYSNRSALLKTKRTFNLTMADIGAGNRFAFFVQPKIGDPSASSKFQIGVVKSPGTNPDLTQLSSYLTYDTTGKSLALDPNSPWITQGNPRALGLVVSPVTNQVDILLGWGNFIFNGAPYTYGMVPKIGASTGVNVGGSYLSIPPGSYQCVVKTTTAAASITRNPVELFVVAGSGDSNVGLSQRVLINNVGEVVQDNVYVLTVTEFDLVIVKKNTAETTAVNTLTILLVPICSPGIAWTSDYGMTEMIRPVGMSVLTTCVMPELTAGGSIQSALYTPSSADKVFTGDWMGSTGFSDIQDYYQGKFALGNYIWWRPSSPKDIDFKSVSEANAYQYPIMLVKGEIVRPLGAVGEDVVAAVTVEFVYEILQNTQLLESKKSVGSTAMYETAIASIANVPYASENPKHSSLLRDIGKVIDTSAKFLPFLSMLF